MLSVFTQRCTTYRGCQLGSSLLCIVHFNCILRINDNLKKIGTVIRKNAMMSGFYNPCKGPIKVRSKSLSASATRDKHYILPLKPDNIKSETDFTRKQTSEIKFIHLVYVYLLITFFFLNAKAAVPIQGRFDQEHRQNIIIAIPPMLRYFLENENFLLPYFIRNRHLLLVTEVDDQQREILLRHVHTQNNNAYDDILYNDDDLVNENTAVEVCLPPRGNDTNEDYLFDDIQGGYGNKTTEHHLSAVHERDTVEQDTFNNCKYAYQTVEQPNVIVCHPTDETDVTGTAIQITVSNVSSYSLIPAHQIGELFLVISDDGRNEIEDEPGENHGQLQLVYHLSEEIGGLAHIHHQILVSAHDNTPFLLGFNETIELAVSTASVEEAISTSEYMESNIVLPHTNHEDYDLGDGQHIQITVSDHQTDIDAQFQQDYGELTATQQCPLPRVLARQYEQGSVTGGFRTESNSELHLFQQRSNSLMEPSTSSSDDRPPTNIQQSGNDTDIGNRQNDI